MSNDTTTKSRPTHRIYSVNQKSEDQADWQAIGAAFAHKDGQGFNLAFSARPLEGARIVLRTIKEKAEDAA